MLMLISASNNTCSSNTQSAHVFCKALNLRQFSNAYISIIHQIFFDIMTIAMINIIVKISAKKNMRIIIRQKQF